MVYLSMVYLSIVYLCVVYPTIVYLPAINVETGEEIENEKQNKTKHTKIALSFYTYWSLRP